MWKVAASVVVASLCVIGLVYSDALQQRHRLTAARPRADVQGVTEISQPFSFANSTSKVLTPRIVNLSAESLVDPDRFSSDSADRYPGRLQSDGVPAAAGWVTTIGPTGPSRASMLFFRRSLPTFSQARPPGFYQSLWTAGTTRYLDTSFSSLMDNVFMRGDDPALVASLSRQKQDLRNPFTEAKQEAEAAAAPAAAPTTPPPPPPPAKPDPAPDPSPSTPPPPPAQQTPGGGSSPKPAPPEGPLVIIGDFAGTGVLEARTADQDDAGTFVFADGKRTFNLFINPAAVENQRSLAIDDFNNDGKADLLVTSRAAAVGAVLLGNGHGDFAVADTFVTGYEPVVPVAGQASDGSRDILTVNVRSGWVQTFRRTDSYRMTRGQATVPFSPDFVARLTETGSGSDCLMAAQSGGAADVYQWQSDGTLVPSGVGLPQAPSISINKDFLQENSPGNLQIYQVGSSASVMLTASGASFNVANFRSFPGIFLIVGDISKHGTLDVAVACLLSTTPTD